MGTFQFIRDDGRALEVSVVRIGVKVVLVARDSRRRRVGRCRIRLRRVADSRRNLTRISDRTNKRGYTVMAAQACYLVVLIVARQTQHHVGRWSRWGLWTAVNTFAVGYHPVHNTCKSFVLTICILTDHVRE